MYQMDDQLGFVVPAADLMLDHVVKCLTPDLLVRHLNEGLCRFKLALALPGG